MAHNFEYLVHRVVNWTTEQQPNDFDVVEPCPVWVVVHIVLRKERSQRQNVNHEGSAQVLAGNFAQIINIANVIFDAIYAQVCVVFDLPIGYTCEESKHDVQQKERIENVFNSSALIYDVVIKSVCNSHPK